MLLRVSAPLILIVLVAAFPALAQRDALKVGNITARPGEVTSGIIPIPAADDPGTELPITRGQDYVLQEVLASGRDRSVTETPVFLGFGIVAAFRNLYRMYKKAQEL